MMGNRKKLSFIEHCAGGRRTAARVLSKVWQPALMIGLGVALVVGSVTAWRTLCDSDHFVLKEVTVESPTRLCLDEIAFICGLEVGRDNLLFMTESGISETCLGDSRVRWAEATIELPERVSLRIEEHVPVLYVATAFGLWEVSSLGRELGPVVMNRLQDFPLLLGMVNERRTREKKQEIFRDALALLRTVAGEESPWKGQSLVVEYDPDLGYAVRGTDRGPRARFGWAPFCRKFDRLVEALAVAKRESLWVREALLDNTQRPNSVTLKIAMSGRLAALDRESTDGMRSTGLEDDHETEE